MTINFLNGYGDITSKYDNLPDMKMRNDGDLNGFFPEEQKHVNTETNEEMLNTDYDQTIDSDLKGNSLQIDEKIDDVLNITDKWKFDDSKNNNGNTYTQNQIDEINTYRESLRRWKQALIDSNFSTIRPPSYPSSIPQRDQNKIDRIFN